MHFASRVQKVQSSAIRDLLRHGTDPSVVSFAGGFPDPTLFPAAQLQTIYNDLLTHQSTRALQYTVTEGIPELRAHVARRMTADGTPTTPDDVLILHGAQQGLDLAAKMMLEPGDPVIVENPTFLGATIAFNVFEPTYATVRLDDQGLDTDHLEAVLKATPGAKLLYTVPDFHNPTGVTMSLPRRKRLLELANEFDLLVIEDSPYRPLRFEGAHLPTLRSLDTEGRVLFLGSFAKILAPGMRLGWAVASPEVLSKLARLKLANDTQSSTLNQMAAAQFFDRFDIDAHIARTTAAYRHKRQLMFNVLDDVIAQLPPDTLRYTCAEGGLFTWLTFPQGFDTTRFMLDHCIPSAKVVYVPGAPFYALSPEINHARLNFSALPEAQLTTGMQRLAGLLTETLQPTPTPA
jgi:2-aminoadipate transaminase